MRQPSRWARAATFLAGLLVPTSASIEAQIPSSLGNERMAWMLRNLRPSGQPVIPIFEGWYENEDGTRSLCFGYYSLNTEQELDIPLGPDNFIEPSRFDGLQPTHFSRVPPEYRRHFCVFTVDLPGDYGAADVTWTLRIDGRSYSVPGHTTSEHYQLEEPVILSRGLAAPVVELVEPRGPTGRGRANDLVARTTVTAGEPLPLTLSLSNPSGDPVGRVRVVWDKHQGPGAVAFGEEDVLIREDRESLLEVSTTATLSAPGEYLLRVQAVDWTRGNSFGYECCWTNGFVRVTVGP
ncbi:MAG TPA: hypothetical protein VLA09_02000 [Longimicrobiales bacterium]|nr:hypothetical protein [Longimicrobiales bacterium]